MIARLLHRISLSKTVCERALEWRGSGVKTKKMLKVPAGNETCTPQSQSGGAKNSARLGGKCTPRQRNVGYENSRLSVASAH